MDLSTSYTIKAKVEGQKQISGLETGLNKLKVSTNNTATAMSKLKTAAGNAFGVLKNIAPVLGVAAIGKMVNDTLQLGDSLDKMSQKTGIAVPVLDKLRQAADLGGTDFKVLSKAFPTLAKNMQDASRGIGTARKSLDEMGISVLDSQGNLKQLDDIFFEIGDSLKNFSEEKGLAMVGEIFGTGIGSKLIPIMKQGSESIQALKTGFDQELAERMAAFNDRVTQLGERFKILRTELTKLLLDLLEKLVNLLTDLTDKFLNLPPNVQKTIGVLVLVGSALAIAAPAVFTLVTSLAALIFSFKMLAKIKLATVLGTIVAKFVALKGGVLLAVSAFAPLLAGAAIPAAIIGLGVLIFKFRDQIGSALQAVGQFFINAFSPLTEFIGGVFNGAMDMARNAFNRLPNIVQEAIKVATAPLRGFINFLQRILSLLGRVRKAKSNPPKPPTNSTSTSTSTTSSTPPLLPRTSGYQESNLSTGNVGEMFARPTQTYTIPSSNPSNLSTTQLPNNGFRITQNTNKPKPPNINIQTGNVVQMDNQNFVTTTDLQNAVQSATTQTMNYIQAGNVIHYL